MFVKNYLSTETPYNSMLIFHGLGTGKTCTAIINAEMMRDYLERFSIKKKIYIVASPAVQDNFKMQFFNEKKLKKINGQWDLQSCVGTKLMREINPTQMKNLSKRSVIKAVKKILRDYYVFIGYTKLGNLIRKNRNNPKKFKDTALHYRRSPTR